MPSRGISAFCFAVASLKTQKGLIYNAVVLEHCAKSQCFVVIKWESQHWELWHNIIFHAELLNSDGRRIQYHQANKLCIAVF